MIEITVTRGNAESRVQRFEGSLIRIGRGEDNDLVLSSQVCSRHHAEIVQDGETYLIKDLGSANGIRHQSQRVNELKLVDGMRVEIGDQSLHFSLASPDAQTVLLDTLPEAKTLVEAPAPLPPPPAADRPVLHLVYKRQGQVQNLKVVGGVEYVIGRAPDADLVLDDKQASKYHAKILSAGDEFRIRDNNSSNGTMVDGERITEAPLHPGSQIAIANTVITAQSDVVDLADDAMLLEHTMFRKLPPGTPGPAPTHGSSGQPAASPAASRRLSMVAAAVGALAIVGAGAWVLFSGGDADRGGTREGADVAVDEASVSAAADELIVQVASVSTKELIRSVDGTATINPVRLVTVSAESAGQVVALPVEEGAPVSRGQLLAQVDDSDVRLQIEEARSAVSEDQLNLAREDYERKQRLFDNGVTTRSVVDQARHQYLSIESAFNSAQATIQRLEEQLRRTRITAPISGRVATRHVNLGEFLAPGSPLVLLENVEEMIAALDVSNRDVVKIQEGQVVEVGIDAFPDRVMQGVVDNIASAANPVTRTFTVEAVIDNRDGSLRSGMLASLRIVLERTQGLVVPDEALLERRDDQADVFVVSEDTARRVSVRLGDELDREVEVLEGLSEGDDVVVYGHERIRDGQPVASYRRR